MFTMLWIALQTPDEAASTLPSPSLDSPTPAPDVQALSWWALQFSPRVTVLEGAVLVEVQASERLFGGRKALLGRMRQGCADLQVARMAVAPTALAARGLLRCMPCAAAPALAEAPARAKTNSQAQANTHAASQGQASTAPPPPSVAVAACAPRQLGAVLDALPISALLATQPHAPTLQRLGCERLGQLRALPRGGLSRRFGAALLAALDQAYGQQTELYPWVVLPEQFRLRLEFNARIEVAEGLMFGAHRLLGSLKAWLTARQCGVTSICLHWEHDLQRRGEAKAGSLEVRTGQATTDMQHLARLLAENLARTTLLAPVVAITLDALAVEPLPTASASLLPDDIESGGSLQQLLERLSARLGAQRVLTGHTTPDHRPQRMQAWAPSTLAGATRAGTATSAPRKVPTAPTVQKARTTSATPDHWATYPCWILRQPLRLAVVKDKPIYQGPLQLMAGPERVETGWWPECASDSDLTQCSAPHAFSVRAEPVEAFANPSTSSGRTDLNEQHGDLTLRDYFIASSEMAGLLWIYRQRTGLAHPGALDVAQVGWYLHGIYG
jgi:protein ImuB